jgi:hypothetical protein
LLVARHESILKKPDPQLVVQPNLPVSRCL